MVEIQHPRVNMKIDHDVYELMKQWKAEFVEHENYGVEMSWNQFFMLKYRRRKKY